jgi:hypothetical protein
VSFKSPGEQVLVLGLLGHIPAPFERIRVGRARARLARRICRKASTRQ